jgi:hypothetical protein
MPHNAASDQLPGHHTSAGPDKRYGVFGELIGLKADGCDHSAFPPAAGHLGASQFTIHLTPNLSVTIPKASAQ